MSASASRWCGDERCDFCLQRYVLELEVVCVDCDRALCPFCATRVRLTGHHCPECADGAPAPPRARRAGR